MIETKKDKNNLFSPIPNPDGHFLKAPLEVSISVSDNKSQWIAVPPIPAVAVKENGGKWKAVGVFDSIEKMDFSEILFRISENGQIEMSTDGSVPQIRFFTSQTPLHAIKLYIDELEKRNLIPPEIKPISHLKRIFCGWGEQVKENPRNPSELSNQEFYDYLISKLKESKMWNTINAVVIDDKWQESYSHLIPDRTKWKNLRKWIDSIHEEGKRVVLWFKLWDSEGADDIEIDRESGRVNPVSEHYRNRLKREIEFALGKAGLNADGFKLDYLALTPRNPVNGIKGFHLIHEYLSFIYRTSAGIKSSVIIESHSPSPHFRDTLNIYRLNDITPQMKSKVKELMKWRMILGRIALGKEVPIDSDDWNYPSEKDKNEYRATRKKWGVVESFYYLE